MKRFRGVNRLLCFVSFGVILISLLGVQVALADEEEPAAEEPKEEKFELTSRFPVKQGESGASYEFEVSLDYQGNEAKVFEFALTKPEGWDASVTRTSTDATDVLLAQTLEANQSYAPIVAVKLTPLPGNMPEPGEYVLTLEAFSSDLRDSIELKAEVTSIPDTYELKFTTANGRLDYPVKPGEENPILVVVTNTGTGTFTNLSFTSVKSEGWGTTFAPSMTPSLAPGESIEAQINMTPPRKTVAGDYRVLVRVGADSEESRFQEQLDLRIRVQASTLWGGVGIAIVAAVIVGLAFMFRQLGRR